MGNAIANAWVAAEGSEYMRSCTCCDWFFGSVLESLLIRIGALIRIAIWVVARIVSFIFMVLGILMRLIAGYLLLYYFALLLVISWGVWWLAPDVLAFVVDPLWPFINYMLMIGQYFFNLFVMLYNLLSQLWNNLCPLLGMWWSIIFGLMFTMLTEVMKLIGGPAIMTLFQALLNLRILIIQLVTTLLESILSLVSPVLQLFIHILGPMIGFVMQYVPIMLQMVFFFITKLVGLLLPVFKLLMWVIAMVADLFGKSLALRVLLSLSGPGGSTQHPRLAQQAPSTDDLQTGFLRVLADNTRQQWTDRSLNTAVRDSQQLVSFVHQHPAKSAEYYFEATHPIWSSDYDKSRLGDFDQDPLLRSQDYENGLYPQDYDDENEFVIAEELRASSNQQYLRDDRDDPIPSFKADDQELDFSAEDDELIMPTEDEAEVLVLQDQEDNARTSARVLMEERSQDEQPKKVVIRKRPRETKLDDMLVDWGDGTKWSLKDPRELRREQTRAEAPPVQLRTVQRGVEPSLPQPKKRALDSRLSPALRTEWRWKSVQAAIEQSAAHRAAISYFDSLKDEDQEASPLVDHHRHRRRDTPQHQNEFCTENDVLCKRHQHKHPLQHIAEAGTRHWSPKHSLSYHRHGSHGHRQHMVAVAVLAHSIRHGMRWASEDHEAVMLHKKAWEHTTSAFSRLTGHQDLESLVVDWHQRYANGMDVVHDMAMSVPQFPQFNSTKRFQPVKSWDPEHESRPFYTDWVRQHQGVGEAHQVHPSTGMRQRTHVLHPHAHRNIFLAGDGSFERAAMRHMLGVLPFLDLLASTDCFTSKPRNPMCLPNIFPDGFLLDLGVPIAEPAWLKDFSETCSVYFYEPSRNVPMKASGFFSWFSGNSVLGPQRMINGVCWYLLIFNSLFNTATYTIEKFGLEVPLLSWISSALLILPGGQLPSIQLILCIIAHTYDGIYDALLIYLFVVVVWPIVQWFWSLIPLSRGLFGILRSHEEDRIARQKTLIESQLFNEAYDTVWNSGLAEYGDHARNHRDALGVARHGLPLNPLGQTSPLDYQVSVVSPQLQNMYWGDGSGIPNYLPRNQMNPYEQQRASAVYQLHDGEYRSRYYNGYQPPYTAPGPSSRSQQVAGELGTEQPVPMDTPDVFNQQQLQRLAAQIEQALRTFGTPERTIDYDDQVRWERRNAVWLRPLTQTYDWFRQQMNVLQRQQDLKDNFSPGTF